MKQIRRLVIFIFVGIRFLPAHSQNALPDFSVRELTRGKIQVSWNNPYASCIQLAIQRSADSTSNFRTIFSTLSPELPSNGFVDNKPVYGRVSYYRIFYVLLGGAYYFTKPIGLYATSPFSDKPLPKADASRRGRGMAQDTDERDMIRIYIKGAELFKLSKTEYQSFRDSINTRTKDALSRINPNAVEWRPAKRTATKESYRIYFKNMLLASLDAEGYKKYKDSINANTKDTLYVADQGRVQLRPFVPPPSSLISVYRNDSLVMQIDPLVYRRFRDSIATQTKDTLYSINSRELEIHPFMVKYLWRPSSYVFTNHMGYVSIILPQVKQHRYRVVFFDEDASEIFQIKSIKETELVLDKANFMHAGWFYFELYEDDKLKEKNRFFLTKD